MLQSPLNAVILFAILCLSYFLGFFIRERLPEHHRNGDTASLIQLAVALLVNFTAIVLGLLTTSVRSGFDEAYRARGADAAQIVQFDRSLRQLGPAGDPMRAQLRAYVAAVIASTWPDETPPQNIDHPDVKAMPVNGESPVLSQLLDTIGVEILSLTPGDPRAGRLIAECERRFHALLDARWKIIEGENGSISPPFYWVLAFWLGVMFLAFGLIARPTAAIGVVIGLCAVSIAVAVFVILDLDQPYGGMFGISSASTRAALADLMRP